MITTSEREQLFFFASYFCQRQSRIKTRVWWIIVDYKLPLQFFAYSGHCIIINLSVGSFPSFFSVSINGKRPTWIRLTSEQKKKGKKKSSRCFFQIVLIANNNCIQWHGIYYFLAFFWCSFVLRLYRLRKIHVDVLRNWSVEVRWNEFDSFNVGMSFRKVAKSIIYCSRSPGFARTTGIDR
jgi:hypothetical protein